MDNNLEKNSICLNDNVVSGEINGSLSVERCLKLGAVFGKLIGEEKKDSSVCVGFIGNTSTNFISLAFITGLISYNINCYNVGEAVLGELLFSSKQLSADYSVFIYQSENVLNISFFNKYNLPLDYITLMKLEASFNSSSFEYKTYQNFGSFINAAKIKELYKTDVFNYLIKSDNNFNLSIASKNKKLELVTVETLKKLNINISEDSIKVILSETGDDFSFIENNLLLDKNTLLLFLYKYELDKNASLTLPEEVLPYLEFCLEPIHLEGLNRFSFNLLDKNGVAPKLIPYITDSYLAMLRIISIMKKENIKLSGICDFIKYHITYRELPFSNNKDNLKEKLDISFNNSPNEIISFGKNNIFFKQIKAKNKLLIIAKSYDEEFADEILDKLILLLDE